MDIRVRHCAGSIQSVALLTVSKLDHLLQCRSLVSTITLPLFVYFQITLLEKSSFTKLTEKRFFAFLMNLFMFVQVRLSEAGFRLML